MPVVQEDYEILTEAEDGNSVFSNEQLLYPDMYTGRCGGFIRNQKYTGELAGYRISSGP